MSKLVIDKEFFLKQSEFLFTEFINNNEKYQTLAYFRRSPEAWLIMLKIMENYYADTDIHVEELINKIPNHIASRLSIFSLIDDADKKGFIIKVESNGDKRKKTIQPSEKFISEYNEWLSNFVTNSNIKL
jgi:DNA-binding MarR family transcriptional regulator